jgi:hypothetical protein
MKEFGEFVDAWLLKKLKPLCGSSDTSVPTWLAGTRYPFWRKEELAKKWSQVAPDEIRYDNSKKRLFHRCKSFMKDETYGEYKHARSINSRSDEFKCLVGPIFRLIEKEVFKLKYFIKKIPVCDRPAYIKNLLYTSDGKYSAGDYTTFEALFERITMDKCEFKLYDYMTKYLPEHDHFMAVMKEVLGGRNTCVFKNFKISTDAKRMSGEMCTSLGNGFSNLMFMKFACYKFGSKCDIAVEGDDSIGQIFGPPPTTEFFARMGLIIKLDTYSTLEEASFCGIIFDPDDCINVTDPREVLAGFGWTTQQYARAGPSKKKALLRSKALSFAYQYPGCPIIAALARYVMRCTKGVDVRKTIANWRNTYEREQLQDALEHPVAFRETLINTRLLVEKLYHISVEHQLEIEKYFDSLDTIIPISIEQVKINMSPIWAHYWDNYVLPTTLLTFKGETLSHPPMIWTQKKEYALQNPLSAT